MESYSSVYHVHMTVLQTDTDKTDVSIVKLPRRQFIKHITALGHGDTVTWECSQPVRDQLSYFDLCTPDNCIAITPHSDVIEVEFEDTVSVTVDQRPNKYDVRTATVTVTAIVVMDYQTRDTPSVTTQIHQDHFPLGENR